MKPLLINGFFVTGAVSVLIAQLAWAQVTRVTESSSQKPISEIPRLSEIEFPLTSAKGLSSQLKSAIPYPTPLENASYGGEV